MIDKQQIIIVQNEAVQCLANGVSEKWDYLLVNCERAEFDGEQRYHGLAMAFVKDKGKWKSNSIIVSHKCYSLLLKLSQLMSMDGSNPWGSCTVEVDSSGKYRFSFSYDPPRRIYGVIDDDTLFNEYTPQAL
jgi:hypothetical protein